LTEANVQQNGDSTHAAQATQATQAASAVSVVEEERVDGADGERASPLGQQTASPDTAASAPEITVPLPAGYDPSVRANLLLSYIIGRWHRYVRSGFARTPGEHADAQLLLILQ
jgi:TetR/AcrR family transcriptional regulator